MAKFRHLKTGGVYEVVDANAKLQCSRTPAIEHWFADETLTIYQSVETGRFFVRPTVEFMDGRFERVD